MVIFVCEVRVSQMATKIANTKRIWIKREQQWPFVITFQILTYYHIIYVYDNFKFDVYFLLAHRQNYKRLIIQQLYVVSACTAVVLKLFLKFMLLINTKDIPAPSALDRMCSVAGELNYTGQRLRTAHTRTRTLGFVPIHIEWPKKLAIFFRMP